MAPGTTARIWFALTSIAVAVGLVVQLIAARDNTEGFFTGPNERLFNVFCFFTIQSNILVGVGCAILAAGRASSATWFRTLRLLGTIAITLTFVVFYAVLRDDQDLSGKAAVADFLLHTVSPVMCVIGWVWFGPRRLIDRLAIGLTIVYLLAWGAFTLIRGEIVGFYPYPFIDVSEHGYGPVALNLVVVGAIFVAFGFGAEWLDRRLAERGIGILPATDPGPG